MALIEESSGNPQAALALYRRVVYLEPNHLEALVHMAALLEQSGDPVRARQLYERAQRAAQGTPQS
jgi:chemotaxis protein methyltransferase WspC